MIENKNPVYYVAAPVGTGVHFISHLLLRQIGHAPKHMIKTPLNEYIRITFNYVSDKFHYENPYHIYGSHIIDHNIEKIKNIDTILIIKKDKGFNGAHFLGKIKKMLISVDEPWFISTGANVEAINIIGRAYEKEEVLEKIQEYTSHLFSEDIFLNFWLTDKSDEFELTYEGVNKYIQEEFARTWNEDVLYDVSHIADEIIEVNFSDLYFGLEIPYFLEEFRDEIIEYSKNNIRVGLEMGELLSVPDATDFFTNANERLMKTLEG